MKRIYLYSFLYLGRSTVFFAIWLLPMWRLVVSLRSLRENTLLCWRKSKIVIVAWKTVSASFTQVSSFAGFEENQESSGTLHFKKPGKMDWRYISPITQRFVSDGETMWHYQPEDKQVSLYDFTGAFQSGLPVSFLLGIGELAKSFRLVSACSSSEGKVLRLEPKEPDPQLNSFFLLVRNGDFSPIGARMLDFAENETKIVFSELTLNKPLEDKSFTFVIPKGVFPEDRRGAVVSSVSPASSSVILEKSLLSADGGES